MYNRRLLLILLSIVLFLLSIKVDKTHGQSIEFGITGGLTASTHLKAFAFIEDDISLWLNPKLTTGFNAGFIARKNVSEKVRLQAEPSLILLGARYEQPFTLRGFEFDTESRTKLTYLQLPLLVQLSSTPEDRTVYGRPFNVTTYHLTGGFFGGYLLDAQFSGTNTGAPIGVEFEGEFANDVINQYKKFDGGIMLGVGLEHGNSNKIGFEARAQFSILESGEHPNTQFFKPRNFGVTLAVYYLL